MSNLQAVLFDKNYWTKSKASSWLADHKYKPIKPVHVTNNYLRYRLKHPDDSEYRIINLGKNIKAVYITPMKGRGLNISKLISVRPDHYARLLRPIRGGSLYSLMANNHGLINGIVGGIHALASLAALGGIGYAIKRKINK